MARITPLATTLALALLAASGCGQASAPATAASAADQSATTRPAVYPPAVQAIVDQGLEILGEFDAPGGLRGYAGLSGQQPIAVYATADGQHAIIGTLVDAAGNDASAAPLQRLVAGPMSQRIWSALDDSHWVPDGKADAPRVVYTFSDPNCPYCNRFWEAARPWVESGQVQLRHVMVGVIKADSANKVAAILSADAPERALVQNERSFSRGGIRPAAKVPDRVRSQLAANELLMASLGFHGTPAIVYRDADGIVQRYPGMPRPAEMEQVLGPRPSEN